jgi:beta-aspartyl-peptidase (threonine type)
MKQLTLMIMLCYLVIIACNESPQVKTAEIERPVYAIVIHGGAGTILKKNMSPEKDKAYRTAMNEALNIGESILKSGGSSIDAVEKTINFMENSELFNAGKGAVFTHEGKNEMDASIMYGKDQNAGAVGGVTNIKHPISAARAVLEKSDHVMMAGKGAEDFAKKNGIEIVDPAYFKTERRWNSLQRGNLYCLKVKIKTKNMAQLGV